MTPRHVAPLDGLRVVLEKKMVFTFVIEKAVGIIHPIACWREVELRAVFLVAQFAIWVRNHGTYLILTV